MGRPLRIHYHGALFHVFGRGSDRHDIFLDDSDRISFLFRLARIKKEYGFSLYSYCLMSNHFHLLVRVGKVSISEIMHRLLSPHGRRLNRRLQREGHFFQDRFQALHCAGDVYFRELVRYINMNPVAAGLVKSPEDWGWSSYSELTGKARSQFVDADFVRSILGDGESIRRFVLREDDLGPRLLELVKASSDESPEEFEAAGPPSLPLEEIGQAIAVRHRLEVRALKTRSRLRPLSLARRDFIKEAIAQGHLLANIARFLERSSAAVSRIAGEEREALLERDADRAVVAAQNLGQDKSVL